MKRNNYFLYTKSILILLLILNNSFLSSQNEFGITLHPIKIMNGISGFDSANLGLGVSHSNEKNISVQLYTGWLTSKFSRVKGAFVGYKNYEIKGIQAEVEIGKYLKTNFGMIGIVGIIGFENFNLDALSRPQKLIIFRRHQYFLGGLSYKVGKKVSLFMSLEFGPYHKKGSNSLNLDDYFLQYEKQKFASSDYFWWDFRFCMKVGYFIKYKNKK